MHRIWTLFSFALVSVGAAIFVAPDLNAAGRGMTFPDDSKLAIERQLEKAVRLIKNERYEDAIEQLKKAKETDPKNPDVYNLLGFASRKLGRLDEAGPYYEQALALDPDHLGALEYQGELFLMQSNIDGAKANLAKLAEACGDCEEYRELEEAIQTFEAGGTTESGSAW
jgi:tetratricopeptide (TPR) repeat protein